MWLGSLPLLLLPAPIVEEDSLPARAELFAPGGPVDIQLSIDGAFLGWLAPDSEGVHQLYLAPVSDPSEAIAVTKGEEPVLEWRWATSDEHVIFTREVEGGHVHAFVISKQGGSVFDVTRGGVGPLRLVGHNRQWRTSIALDYQPKDEERGVWLLDFGKQQKHRMTDGGHDRVFFDGNMWPMGAENPGRSMRMKLEGKWGDLVSADSTEAPVTGIVSGDFGGDFLFYCTRGDGDRSRLQAIDLDTLEVTVLLEHPTRDLFPHHFQLDTRTQMPVSALVGGERIMVDPKKLAALFDRAEPVTANVADDWEIISLTLPGAVQHVDEDLLGGTWLLQSEGLYYLYDRESLDLRAVKNFGQRTTALTPFDVQTADDLTLHCALARPAGQTEPGPTVVFVHGGPWSPANFEGRATRDQVELLVSRGYTVLLAEYRGATGYGRAFRDLGDGELGDGMIDDVLAATRAAIERKVADPEKIAIFGWSYGGYAVLRAMTREPKLFACGLAINPISDLAALQAEHQDHPAWRELWNARAGDPTTEEGAALLKRQSPLHQASELAAPILIASGTFDLIVPKEQSEAFVRAARNADRGVTYLLLDEPHDFKQPSSWSLFWAAGEALLADKLGGEAEPFGDDMKAPQLSNSIGTELIPGLREALR